MVGIIINKKMMEEYVQQQYENFRIPLPSHNDSLLSLLDTDGNFNLSKRGTLSAQELGEDIAAYAEDCGGEDICVLHGYQKAMTPLLYAETAIFVAEIKRVVERCYNYDVEVYEEDDRFVLNCKKPL
jgi:hypothetical protein